MAVECMNVKLKSIKHHKINANNPAGVPFLIATTTRGQSVKGSMVKAIEGAEYRLWGEWREQNGPYPPAFCFIHHEPIVSSESPALINHYLANFIDGLGPIKSAALVNEFGADTLRVLRETPDEALSVKGITEDIVETIRDHFANQVTVDPQAYSELAGMFAGHKFPARLIMTLLKHFGSDAPSIVRENPYILIKYPRMGWKGVDAFAISPAIGFPADGLTRQASGILEALAKIVSDGHTIADKFDVESAAFRLIGMLPSDEAWAYAVEELGVVLLDDGRCSLAEVFDAEERIAERLALLADNARPLAAPLPVGGLLEGQATAAKLIEQHGVVIITGGPGTGKSYTLAQVMTGLVSQGVAGIRFMAPTGKAAKRSAELIRAALPGSRIPSTTIHAALKPIPSGEEMDVPEKDAKMHRGREAFSFSHDSSNPIPASVIVVEESSMLDVVLAADLFDAIAPGTRVILVGDENQLPSVGPGSVLRDLIAAGVPTARLTEVQRNCGTIVQACADIVAGRTPTPADKIDLPAGKNWVHVELHETEDVGQRIVGLNKGVKSFHPTKETQIISPERDKFGIGCKWLNRKLSEALNRYRCFNEAQIPQADRDDAKTEPLFVCGDKVVRTKNGMTDRMIRIEDDDDLDDVDWVWGGTDYKLVPTPIVNGDMGEVADIVEWRGTTYVIVDFEDGDEAVRCRLPYGSCKLEPAYAMTAHKCQGSGYPYVILPVHHTFFYDDRTKVGTWCREMFFTMLSRAEKLVVTVGPFDAIRLAVSRPNVGQRRTRLRGLVQGWLSNA